jgi:hypothetical protein
MDMCHICHEEKDIKDTYTYCETCCPFICTPCLEEWKTTNQSCPICKGTNNQEDYDTRIIIPPITSVITNEVREVVECTKMHVVTRSIVIYIILFMAGVLHYLIFVVSDGEDTKKDMKKYRTEPIIFILCPLLGAYVLMLLFIVLAPIVYILNPCFHQRISPLPQAEQDSQGTSGSTVN